MADEDRWHVLEQVISANGGSIAGKTRLQKTMYLLQSLGLETDYEFEYHHYGPYAEGIVEDIEWAKFLGGVKSEERPGHHSVPFTVFETKSLTPNVIAGLSATRLRNILGQLAVCPAVVLELAATLHFLRINGFPENAEKELKVRKPDKAAANRLQAAKKLLVDLKL